MLTMTIQLTLPCCILKISYTALRSPRIWDNVLPVRKPGPHPLGELLLKLHLKLGHTGFFKVHWIGRQGFLENLGENMVSNKVKIPKCAACHYGKQEINIKSEIRKSKDK